MDCSKKQSVPKPYWQISLKGILEVFFYLIYVNFMQVFTNPNQS